jgi:dCMP deaminase
MTSERLRQLESLIQNWGNYRPSWDEYFMAMALLIASRSPCERLHVGCVLVSSPDDKHPHRIIAAGYNGFFPGAPHISVIRDNHEQNTVHAEQNAVTDAARRGVSLQGATAYVTHYPCIHCFKILVAAGIQSIKCYADYKNDPLVDSLLPAAGVTLVKL